MHVFLSLLCVCFYGKTLLGLSDHYWKSIVSQLRTISDTRCTIATVPVFSQTRSVGCVLPTAVNMCMIPQWLVDSTVIVSSLVLVYNWIVFYRPSTINFVLSWLVPNYLCIQCVYRHTVESNTMLNWINYFINNYFIILSILKVTKDQSYDSFIYAIYFFFF